MKTISIIIPAYNEQDTIDVLADKTVKVLNTLNKYTYQIIFIDDGSTDSTWKEIELVKSKHKKLISAYRFRKNFGKAKALNVGFEHARGAYVFTLDADLQDDPYEIPKLLRELENGNDLVIGWKKVRNDPFTKTLPSKLFNKLLNIVFSTNLRDVNSGFKGMTSNLAKSLNLYGELHRFIPILADNLGYKVIEIPVVHHAREFGKSKYGIERFFKGLIDMLTVLATTKFNHRPSHLFGGLGLLSFMVASLCMAYLIILWVLGDRPIGTRPLFLISIMSYILSVQLITLGILAEVVSTSPIKKEYEPIDRSL